MQGVKQKINLLEFDRKGMESFFEGLGAKAFNGRNVLKWIHKHGVTDFDAMTDLSKKLREQLKAIAEVRVPEIVFEQPALDGTHKWVLELDCNNRIESVFIPEPNRSTLCISSQVGCALDCSFCSTAQQGFNRNLTAAEIIGQVWVAERQLGKSLTNV
ncbi:MAG: bifunctional tRNA (adenosine(37)-C2)-methyltransferase TrmG/ribosomal RNA large subunit methyltransferase RlmN, partial [Sedimenticola sp.]|nr:bifunctional tRNA (adenosine(37)-C2)-methyltransferase TrmG/ribosomal RNA large subunit methyltransferase RlmN [Sedimenticola sp.]